MKNNPNKATIEEITRLYHYIILPLLVEIDQNLKSKKILNVGCVASFHAPLNKHSRITTPWGEAASPANQVGLEQ